MPTNLAIDDRLLEKALELGGLETKKATVNKALEEFIEMRSRRKIADLFGRIDFDPKWDYKADRKKR